jgi:hypothetical protein
MARENQTTGFISSRISKTQHRARQAPSSSSSRSIQLLSALQGVQAISSLSSGCSEGFQKPNFAVSTSQPLDTQPLTSASSVGSIDWAVPTDYFYRDITHHNFRPIARFSSAISASITSNDYSVNNQFNNDLCNGQVEQDLLPEFNFPLPRDPPLMSTSTALMHGTQLSPSIGNNCAREFLPGCLNQDFRGSINHGGALDSYFCHNTTRTLEPQTSATPFMPFMSELYHPK